MNIKYFRGEAKLAKHCIMIALKKDEFHCDLMEKTNRLCPTSNELKKDYPI